MERKVGQEGTTNIRPIPPQLEFPFPRTSDDLSTSPATTLPTTNTSPDYGIRPSADEKVSTQLRDKPLETRRMLRDTNLPLESPQPSSSPATGGVTKLLKNQLDPFAEPPGPSETATNPSSGREPSRPSKSRSQTSWLSNKAIRSKGDVGSARAKQSSHADQYGRFSVGNENYKAKGKVNKTSGRLDISLNDTANRGYLAKALGASLNHHLRPKTPHHDQSYQEQQPNNQQSGLRRPDLAAKLSTSLRVPSLDDFSSTPVLNIVIMVIGSRGDIQPFLKIGKLLKETYGHNVRIATHPAFKKFVEEECGLSFFSVGGDPAELMAFMVKNPGLIPSVATVRAGEIGRRRDAMFEMFQGFWRACVNATDDETGASNRRMMAAEDPFVADAIIANPPSFAHVHCAERLGIPLHLMFTFPYSPTQQFPHPLANIKASSGPEIDIAGFVFLDLASSFKPPEGLSKFLKAGEPPVYIGFGSIVVDEPDQFTTLIFEAIQKAGVRALVSKGWGGLGDEGNTPKNVYMLENTPHDWLFPRVSAVVHHGGAGTTAIGLKCGKPTMIVPFFGDQPFWGAMVAKAGAGADSAVPYKQLTVDALANGIRQCLSPEAKRSAEKLAHDIEVEGDGAKNAVEAFHRHLPLVGESSMRCCVFQDRIAVWVVKNTRLRLSNLAAELIVEKGKLSWQDMRLARHQDWNDFEGPGEPITGGGAALAKSFAGIAKGIGGVPVRWAKSLQKHEQPQEQRERHRKSVIPKRSRADLHGRPRDSDASKSRTRNRRSKAYEEHGELSQGGQHGAETKLPEPNSFGNIPGRPELSEDGDGDIIGPRPSHPLQNNVDAGSLCSTDSSEENIAQELAEDTGRGFAKSGQALAKVPMDLSLAIAQGFHNAPRLYGDATVRTPTRITGFHSGLRATGEEFAFGVYDGVTGLVLQPYRGAKQSGTTGFISGVGKGFGGFILKDFAALTSVAYTFKGIHKEMTKGRQPTAFIRRARIAQSRKEVEAQDEEDLIHDRQKVDLAWQIVCEIRKETERYGKGGVLGRIRVIQERRKMERQGAFKGSVWQAKKVVEEEKMSRFIEEDVATNAEVEENVRKQHLSGKHIGGRS
ncbi:MAG: hypothetical protein Q9195_003794 [Heterodermia aff. obscurata]